MMQIYDIISSNITKNHYKEHNNTNYKCFLTYVHKINLREINKMKRYKKITSYIILFFIIVCLTGCSYEKLPEESTENELEQAYADVLESKEKEEKEVKEQETKETEEEEAKEQAGQEADEQAKLEAEEKEAREQAMKEREELEAGAGAGEQISVNGKKLLKSKTSYNSDGTLFLSISIVMTVMVI